MTPYKHIDSNFVFNPPESMQECVPLHVKRVKYSDGTEASISYWRPSFEELQQINSGKSIVLVVVGSGHPPVAVGVEGLDV